MNFPYLLAALAIASLAFLAVVAGALRRRSIQHVMADRVLRRRGQPGGTRHIFFSVVDHFEPFWHNQDIALARERVRRWTEAYPRIAERYQDHGGAHPRHAFFCPEEEYPRDPVCMEMLAGLCHRGFGEVEVHLHHDRDTAEALRGRLLAFTHTLRGRHGLLAHGDPGADPAYAFIHGNWVLANSGPHGKDCGVDSELAVLRETGCYADFTFPSAPHPSQPPVVNRIYYPAGDPLRPRAHFSARNARFGVAPAPGILLVNGPLALNWRRRRRGFMPALENGDLTGINPPSPDRTDLWIRTAISVEGFPRWIFVKAYTHGCQERNASRLLRNDRGLGALFADIVERYDDGERHVLHFSTPWEMYRAVRVLESGNADDIRAIERFEYPF